MSWSGIPYAIEAILGERKKRDEIRDKAIKNYGHSTTGDRTMTDNLIERLRDWVPAEGPPEGRTAPDAVADMHEAVDRIEALKADKAKLREALVSMRQAAAGFALAVREVDKDAYYPWPEFYAADAQAYEALHETGQ